MAGADHHTGARQALQRLLVQVAVLVGALGLTAAGAYLAFLNMDLSLRGEIAWGEVVEQERQGADDPGVLVIEFAPDEARTLAIRHSESARPTGLGVGDAVPVNFLPEAPEDAQVLGPIDWVPPAILLLLGPALLVLAIRGIRIESRRLAGPDGHSP